MYLHDLYTWDSRLMQDEGFGFTHIVLINLLKLVYVMEAWHSKYA